MSQLSDSSQASRTGDSPVELKPRDVQTQVKHRILERYLGAWGGIILNGLRGQAARIQAAVPGSRLKHRFVYVDCCSYIGRYSGNTEDFFLERLTGPVPGSPVIGIRALDNLVAMAHNYDIDLQVNTILIEEEQPAFEGLLYTLADEGLSSRVKRTRDFASLGPGEIAVLNTDCTRIGHDLLRYTRQKYTKAFYLLDPYGPSGIPLDFVQAIIASDGHDVMINFPYYDLHKKVGSVSTPSHQAHVNYWTAAFGAPDWMRMKGEVEAARHSRDKLVAIMGMTDDEAEGDALFFDLKRTGALTDKQLTGLVERRLVDLYQTVLMGADPTLTVKTIRLSFPDRERCMFYLFLTTHDPTGALRLNEILYEAGIWEHELRYKRNLAKRLRLPQDQMAFDFMQAMQPAPPEPHLPERPSIEECAEEIEQLLSGQATTRREVYRKLANSIYFPVEVDKALGYLKKQGRARYQGKLSHDRRIEFVGS